MNSSPKPESGILQRFYKSDRKIWTKLAKTSCTVEKMNKQTYLLTFLISIKAGTVSHDFRLKIGHNYQKRNAQTSIVAAGSSLNFARSSSLLTVRGRRVTFVLLQLIGAILDFLLWCLIKPKVLYTLTFLLKDSCGNRLPEDDFNDSVRHILWYRYEIGGVENIIFGS